MIHNRLSLQLVYKIQLFFTARVLYICIRQLHYCNPLRRSGYRKHYQTQSLPKYNRSLDDSLLRYTILSTPRSNNDRCTRTRDTVSLSRSLSYNGNTIANRNIVRVQVDPDVPYNTIVRLSSSRSYNEGTRNRKNRGGYTDK